MLLRSESPSRQGNAPVYEFICGVNDVLIDANQFLVLVKLHQFGLDAAADGKIPKDLSPPASRNNNLPPRVIAERFVDGLIIETGLPPSMEATITRYGIPTIWLNTHHHHATDCVYIDEFHAGRSVTEHLIRLGHRNILFFSPFASPGFFAHYSLAERETGYRQAMAAHGLPARTFNEMSAGSTMATNADLAEKLQPDRGADRVTGIVTYELGQAIKLRGQLQELGLRCPEDVSLIAAEDLHHFRRTWPDLSGITCNRYQLGSEAARMMLAKITNGGQPQPSHIFRGDLITGSSVAPLQTLGQLL